MKILVAHNSYQQSGGEDTAVAAEIALLRSKGNEVLEYRRNNSEIETTSRLSTAISSVWSRKTDKEVSLLCEQFQPEIIHVHNTFPLISPSLYWVASRQNIPVIQTLHNFRLLCPQAMFLREGKVCEDCLGVFPWRAVTRACYHNSSAQSSVVVSMLGLHRLAGSYQDRVDRYIVMNNFCREKFIAGGLPNDRILIKPNFVCATRTPLWDTRSGGIFIGRLSEEKGIQTLIEAKEYLHSYVAAGAIKVIGTGPLNGQVSAAFAGDYLGRKEPNEIVDRLHSALFLVAPSTCYETFGLAAVEAFSCGVAVIASRHGGLAELVSDGVNGLLFDPGDARDLANKIAWAMQNPAAMLRMGRAAFAEYQNKYTPERNYHLLINIYQDALVNKGTQYAHKFEH